MGKRKKRRTRKPSQQPFRTPEAVPSPATPLKKMPFGSDARGDIRYRGPLSYRSFAILGWCCIVLSQALVLMELATSINPTAMAAMHISEATMSVVKNIASMSLPFLLIGNFATLLNDSKSYKSQLIKNGLAAGGVALLYVFFFNQFIVGSLTEVVVSEAQVYELLEDVVDRLFPSGFVAFNLFVDLFLCTLFMYFLNHRPKRVFTGKGIIAFRLLAILPVGYEAACMVIKWRSAIGEARIPFQFFPLLTVKPPVTFAVFMAMVLFVKIREVRFCRRGGSLEAYQAFLHTNRHSLHFSIFMAVLLLVAGIVDFCLLVFSIGILPAEMYTSVVESNLETIPAGWFIGLGQATYLIFLAPIMLLFSYTRTPEDRTLDLAVPAAGIVGIILVYLQGFRQILHIVPLPQKIDVVYVKMVIAEFRQLLDEAKLAWAEIKALIPQIKATIDEINRTPNGWIKFLVEFTMEILKALSEQGII